MTNFIVVQDILQSVIINKDQIEVVLIKKKDLQIHVELLSTNTLILRYESEEDLKASFDFICRRLSCVGSDSLG